MSELPEGWASTNLADIGRWSSGGTPSRSKAEYFGQGVPWVKSGDLPDGLILGTEEQITELGLNNSSAKLMPAGTISLALYGATIGKLGFLTFPAATNQACANVVPNKELIEPRYLFFYLMSERKILIDKGQGGAQPNISQEIVKAHPIVLAPLNEQRRIVAKLEKLLSRVNATQVRLATIPHILKQFRHSVLTAACSGRLTADWRLEHSIKAEENSNHLICQTDVDSLPDTWRLKEMSMLASIHHGFAFKSKDFGGRGPIVLTPGNFTERGTLDFCNKRVVRLARKPEAKWRLNNGDLLVVMTDLSPKKLILGSTVLLQSSETVLHNQRIGLIKPKSNIQADYLRYAMLRPGFKRYVDETATGSLIQHTSPDRILAGWIPVPPQSEQQEIVRRVEALFKTADAVEARYRTAKAHVDKLTQSILAKAFRGDLVPQDPNDEPASILLERINRTCKAEGTRSFVPDTRILAKNH